ncbi:allantoinase PuuE [uncultured Tateyamaria sp.]|uniref:allantoinase PuuE n=1 Tax=uncultured Tateyamaria sp. TaxID=455651 RepID=UPI002629B48B|nr:allantoinase PuuE [uncultured Tateyamaria sp.]
MAELPPRYPRDFYGHGPDRPDAAWPGGARVAVSFVLNYEEGGENCLLHGDAASEAFLSEIVGAAPWPGQRHWNMESIYDYGARAGFWRLHRLFTDAGIPVTVYGVATALARSPAQVEAMQSAKWEIASHGLKWIDYKDHSEADEAADMDAAIALHTEVTGEAPRGWYTGRCSVNTVRLAAARGFDWISDTYDDDLPYWARLGDRDQLILPYTLDCNDMRFATPQGFNAGDQFFAYLRDTFDALYAEGAAGRPAMMSVGLHCRLIGRPGRVQALRRFIDYVQGFEGVWCARRQDIAAHWAETHPPVPARGWHMLDRAAFVETFGGIFEHSPWIAEGAHALELGPAHDTAQGLHNALCRVFRAASDEQRLDVLRAHPDLAGKLAAARRLTAESTEEQASAGLDALTDEERHQFDVMNSTYVAKHGFPFIIAVKDHDKAGILRAFERRIGNDSQTEMAEACRQVERIARLRLEALQ